ncbi:MAG: hypothetical protein AB1728_11265 [Bacteroidota bacterium]
MFIFIISFIASCDKEPTAATPENTTSVPTLSLSVNKSFTSQKKFSFKFKGSESNESLKSDVFSDETDSLALVHEGEYFFQDIGTGYTTRTQRLGGKLFVNTVKSERIDFTPTQLRRGGKSISDDKKLKGYKEFLERIKKDRIESERNRTEAKIEWSKISSDSVINYFKTKGKQTVALGNNRYEISGAFSRPGLTKQITVKMIFNASLPGFEQSEMHIDGRKHSEMISQTADGKRQNAMKFFGETVNGKHRNFLFVKSISN